ncbi:hypothetical protein N866_05055 [Actinotalea ferrariae CF5-4]|uniref:Uncharacterized protein n=1 Tax=Actinotalea ferrariae CF5-4 TaxID=948458 RepID=A0A021VRW5_9CELL|nr:hypothetical protein [Actinotalea ferrariae]EYR62800.1 hypothetical protein N866_05055 [Actinotalea ferrariae CF5-4]
MARLAYAPGDWVVVPLADGTFAPARVVRVPARHDTLTYVFAPRATPPTLDDVRVLDPGDALLAVNVSGLAVGKTWTVLGGRDDFDPAAWPPPEVETEVPFPDGTLLRVERVDESLRRVDSRHVPLSERGRRQPGGAFGSVALERWMPVQLERGALRPVREQVWWPGETARWPDDVVGHAPVCASDPASTPEPAALPARVAVVLPGPDGAAAARSVERVLHRALRGVAEVDGTLLNPDGGEVWVYPQDVLTTVEAVRGALAGKRLPEGSHLLVRVGDEDEDVRAPLQ